MGPKITGLLSFIFNCKSTTKIHSAQQSSSDGFICTMKQLLVQNAYPSVWRTPPNFISRDFWRKKSIRSREIQINSRPPISCIGGSVHFTFMNHFISGGLLSVGGWRGEKLTRKQSVKIMYLCVLLVLNPGYIQLTIANWLPISVNRSRYHPIISSTIIHFSPIFTHLGFFQENMFRKFSCKGAKTLFIILLIASHQLANIY